MGTVGRACITWAVLKLAIWTPESHRMLKSLWKSRIKHLSSHHFVIQGILLYVMEGWPSKCRQVCLVWRMTGTTVCPPYAGVEDWKIVCKYNFLRSPTGSGFPQWWCDVEWARYGETTEGARQGRGRQGRGTQGSGADLPDILFGAGLSCRPATACFYSLLLH